MPTVLQLVSNWVSSNQNWDVGCDLTQLPSGSILLLSVGSSNQTLPQFPTSPQGVPIICKICPTILQHFEDFPNMSPNFPQLFRKKIGHPRHIPIVASFMSSMIFLLCHVHACDHARARFRQATGFEERHSDQRRIVVLLRRLDMRLGGARASRFKHHRFTESQIFESQVLDPQRYVLLFHFKSDVI